MGYLSERNKDELYWRRNRPAIKMRKRTSEKRRKKLTILNICISVYSIKNGYDINNNDSLRNE